MKAISVREPWASAIRDGRKTIEIRSWRTYHQGPLLICSTAPDSRMLCITTITLITPMRRSHEQMAFCPTFRGALAWHLSRPVAVHPRPVTGRQGIYDVPDASVTPVTLRPAELAELDPRLRRWLQARALDPDQKAR
jgi:hypothetical protein